MTTTIKRNSIIEQWGMIIEEAAGNEKRVMDDIFTFLKGANMPNVKIHRDDCSTGLFSVKRNMCILQHDILREYRMFLGVHAIMARVLMHPGFSRSLQADLKARFRVELPAILWRFQCSLIFLPSRTYGHGQRLPIIA